jgi:hypothetical protein
MGGPILCPSAIQYFVGIAVGINKLDRLECDAQSVTWKFDEMPARGTTPTRNSAKIVPQRW